MTTAVAPLLALAGGWTAAALWVHLRGRERLSFMRQVADHSTFLAPYNAFVGVECEVVLKRWED